MSLTLPPGDNSAQIEGWAILRGAPSFRRFFRTVEEYCARQGPAESPAPEGTPTRIGSPLCVQSTWR